jgi:hypothetical protein
MTRTRNFRLRVDDVQLAQRLSYAYERPAFRRVTGLLRLVRFRSRTRTEGVRPAT